MKPLTHGCIGCLSSHPAPVPSTNSAASATSSATGDSSHKSQSRVEHLRASKGRQRAVTLLTAAIVAAIAAVVDVALAHTLAVLGYGSIKREGGGAR